MGFHHQKAEHEQHDQIHDVAHDLLPLFGQGIHEHFDGHDAPGAEGHAAPQEDHPHLAEGLDLLLPQDGILCDVAHEHAGGGHQRQHHHRDGGDEEIQIAQDLQPRLLFQEPSPL